MQLLNISPLSYRILLKEHNLIDGDQVPVLPIKRGSDLYIVSRMTKRHRGKPDRYTRTIAVDTDIDMSHAAYYLHMIHTDKINRFVEAQLLTNQWRKADETKVTAEGSIRLFSMIYNISDDDWSHETMSRMWRKYLIKIKQDKKWTENAQDARHKRAKNVRIESRIKLVEAQRRLSEQIADEIRSIIDLKHRVCTDMIVQMERNILYNNGYNVTSLAKMYDVHHSNISRSLHR